MKTAPYTAFKETRDVPLEVYLHGRLIDSDWWTETLWVERSEDWYGLMASGMKDKRIRVVDADKWRRAPLAQTEPGNPRALSARR